MFRPDLNEARMHDSCKRLEMPTLPKGRFVEAVKAVVKANEAYVPPYGSGATLYVRPYMFGSIQLSELSLLMNISSES